MSAPFVDSLSSPNGRKINTNIDDPAGGTRPGEVVSGLDFDSVRDVVRIRPKEKEYFNVDSLSNSNISALLSYLLNGDTSSLINLNPKITSNISNMRKAFEYIVTLDQVKSRRDFALIEEKLKKFDNVSNVLRLPDLGNGSLSDINDIIEDNKVLVFFKKSWNNNPVLASKDLYGFTGLSELLLYVNGVSSVKEFIRDDSNPMINAISLNGLSLLESFKKKVEKKTKSISTVYDYLSNKNVLSKLEIT